MSDILLDIHIRHTLQTANGALPMEIDLTVKNGEILAVTGASGAGKTTLLRQIAGLVKPDSGKIVCQNNVWLDTEANVLVPAQRRNIGFVFQDYALFPHFTVLENLQFALGKKEDHSRISELLHAVELTELADRKPFQLSGGQQQRVALARALVRQPNLLLLDEPLAALDPSMRKKLQHYLISLKKIFDFTVLIVTHDRAEIFGLAQRVVVMDNGKVVQNGSPAEIFIPDYNLENDLVFYGEILTVELRADHIIVHALIQNAVRTLKFPTDKINQMIPGRSFTINYSLENPEIALLD